MKKVTLHTLFLPDMRPSPTLYIQDISLKKHTSVSTYMLSEKKLSVSQFTKVRYGISKKGSYETYAIASLCDSA